MPGFEGLPGKDLELAAALLDDIQGWIPQRSRASFDRLRELVGAGDPCDDLPRALVHPDPALKNLITRDDHSVARVDWAGAGVRPRVVSLAQLLGTAGTPRGWDRAKLDTIARAYGAHVRLTPAEIDRIEAAMRIRSLWFAAWTTWTKTVMGRPPAGDEWWIRRAAHTDPSLGDAMHAAFGV